MPSNRNTNEWGVYYDFIDAENPGATVDPLNGKHTLDDLGFHMDMPTYPVPTKKEILVSLPYTNGVLDFSKQDGGYHYEPMEYEYHFWGKFDTLAAMRAAQLAINSAFVEYESDISDDYIYPDFFYCTGIGVEFPVIDVNNFYLEAVVRFRRALYVNAYEI